MAKQTEDIIVRLGLEGFQELSKIRSSFRDLGKVTNMTEQDIISVRDSLFDFAKTAGNTEAVNRGLISVITGLRTQADLCGNSYRELTRDLQRLNEVQRGATDLLMAQRNALVSTFSETTRNIRVLQEHRNVLVSLQQQTRENSRAYDTLGNDIAQIGERIQEVTRVSTALNVALSRAFPATAAGVRATLTNINAGIELQRQVIDEIDARSGRERRLAETIRERATAEQALNRALTAQRQLTFGESVRSGREAVRTAAAAFNEPTLTGGYYSIENIGNRMGGLPNTTAGLNQELSELRERLANTTRGSETYTSVAIRMAEVQRQLRTDVMGTAEAFRQLAIAEAGQERRAGKLSAIQEYQRTQGPLAPGVGGYRDPATGAMIARGAYTPGRIRVEESAYPRPIGPIQYPEQLRAANRQVVEAQNNLTAVYERAYVQRAELQSKYEQLHVDKLLQGLDLEGQVRRRAFETELADFDKQLAARDARRRRRLTGMQFAQAAGAAITGGIYGGPEGFLGGVIGSAGGVGGAFAGAAIGAQVGMLRQQLGGTATYAADIGKLQIALRGIVGSQDAYNRALAAAASVTKDLNVPQETAIQGLTRLSAAVLGAGGNVNDSAFAFRAMSEAIKATGGGAEQVDGALLALTQVFSKGKVSAEELNQIAERLPGTFTLFAKATGRTGPELTKALEEGKVGLNDLMKFLESMGGKYGQIALKIAASSEDAGARLAIAFNAMKLDVGRAIQPLGAQLQAALADALRDATPALVGFTQATSAALKVLTDNAAPIAGVLKTLLGFGAVVGAAVGLTQIATAITGIVTAAKALGTVAAGITGLSAAMGVAKLSAESLSIAIASIPGIGWIAAGITALGLLSDALYDNNSAYRNWVDNIGTVIATDFSNSMDSLRAKAKDAFDYIADLLPDLEQQSKASSEGIGTSFEQAFKSIVDTATQSFTSIRTVLTDWWNGLPAPVRAILANQLANTGAALVAKVTSYGVGASQRAVAPVYKGRYDIPMPERLLRGSDGRRPYPEPPNNDKEKAAKAAESLMRKLQSDFNGTVSQLNKMFNTQARFKLNEKLLNSELKIEEAYKQGNITLAEQLKAKQKKVVLDITERVLMEEQDTLVAKLNEGRAKGLDTQEVQNRLDAVLAQGLQLQLERQQLITEQAKEQAEKTKEIKDNLQQVFAPSAAAAGIFDLSGIAQGYTFGEGDIFQALGKNAGTDRVSELGKELRALTDPLSQVLTAAESIGSAFSTSFSSVISGASTAQQALATLFNNIANSFMDMAAKIIAKWIEMAILNTILSLIPGGKMFGVGSSKFDLPGLSGAGALSGGSSIAGATDWASQGGGFFANMKLNALGAAYAANGIQPFAMGGVVRRPTLFAYANGGVPGMGLMGEAGPEAVMPLRRLPSGRLGVESSGGGSTNVTVNVDASGSQVQGDAGRGEALGRAVSAAVQQELIKQRRPGGLLS